MINFTPADVSRLQWSLLLAIALAAAGAVMVQISFSALQTADQAATKAHSEREVAMRKRLHARDDAEAIRSNIATFQRLQARGILGQERRLDWVERLNAIRDARRLPGLHYELAPQLHAADSSGPSTMLSPMKASIGLIHEQDLIGFIDDLQTTVPAHVRTRHCHIARTSGSDAAANGALLQADCDFDWMTLRDPA